MTNYQLIINFFGELNKLKWVNQLWCKYYNPIFSLIEKDFKLLFTLDGASHFGCPLNANNGQPLRYCSRYHDGGNSYRNFLSLRFDEMCHETIWLFCPKKQEAKFLNYYLSFPKRPHLVFLLLQHQESDNLWPLLLKHKKKTRSYTDQGFLSKAVKNRRARERYTFHGLLHVFHLPRKF